MAECSTIGVADIPGELTHRGEQVARHRQKQIVCPRKKGGAKRG